MSALDEALCWSCTICTFNNPLEGESCAMCNNPRPQHQYENLLAIRTEARRQRMLQEEQERIFAMNRNANSINFQSHTMEQPQEQDEEEMAKKILEKDDGEDWNDDDFKDDNDGDIDWGDDDDDDNDNNNNSVEMEDCDEDDYEYEDDEDEDGNDAEYVEDGWGDVNIVSDQNVETDIKVPEMVKPFEVLNPYKLHEYQMEFIREISDELYIKDLDDIGILCRYYRWNKNQLMDEYLANPEDVKRKCGIISSNKALSAPKESGTFDCWLCINQYTDCKQDTFYPLQCGHQYCNQCWSNYLLAQIEKGPKMVMTKCIDPKCKLTLRPSMIIKFLSYKHRMKFEEYMLHSFVSGLNTLQWCPGKECVNAVKAEYGSPITIDCPSCHDLWCFACLESAHLPCTCELAEKWMKLHSTDSENITYMRAFTKQCPKCKNHIEKNQGCNHMTCRCGYEFCWLCRKDWKKTGYGHQCNKPQNVIDEENEQKAAQSYLKRYMFYFSRYEAHEKSAQIATNSIKNAKECIRSFIINKGKYDTIKQYKYSDLQFIEDAILEIVQSRMILQWSYCFGYYLADNCQLKILFESQQGLLESFSDQLHEKAEKKVDDSSQWFTLADIKFRTELINLTKTCAKYRKNFCEALLSDDSLPFIYQKGIK